MQSPLFLYKLIVLYILDRGKSSLSNSQISDLILEKEYTNYFQLQETFSDLITSNLIEAKTIRNSTYYEITEQGSQTLVYFSQEIPSSIRSDIDAYLQDIQKANEDSIVITGDVHKTVTERYVVRCQILDDGIERFALTLELPTESAANSALMNWKQKYASVYDKILEELL